MVHYLQCVLRLARSTDQIWHALETVPRGATHHWPIVAAAARVFDAPLLEALLAEPGCAAILARNEHLTGRHLQRLALWLMDQTCVENAFVWGEGFTPREARTGPDGARIDRYDQGLYDVLRRLARDGRLSRYPFLLWRLLGRLGRPVTAPVMTLIIDDLLATETLLDCATLPTDVMTALDAKLVRCQPRETGLRVRLAEHPSATPVVWRAMMRHRPDPITARAIGAIPGALDDPETAWLVSEHDER
jgi:hypothetical protein